MLRVYAFLNYYSMMWEELRVSIYGAFCRPLRALLVFLERFELRLSSGCTLLMESALDAYLVMPGPWLEFFLSGMTLDKFEKRYDG